MGTVSNKGTVTALLQEWSAGSEDALAALAPLVSSELHRMASAALRRERPGHMLQPTALVNEVYLRLVGRKSSSWETRRQFFALTARLMRHILVDYYRSARAARRLPQELMTPLTEEVAAPTRGDMDLSELDTALSALQETYPRQVQVVEQLFFAGNSVAETASILGISESTVKRDWRMARAWLSLRLGGRPTARVPGISDDKGTG